MRTHFLYLIVLLFAWSNDLDAQKLHYSYYQFAPLDVNPANSGAFSGSYRVSGIYTKKGFQIAEQGYQNLSISADAPIVRGIRKQDWIGVGLKMDVINDANNSGTRYLDDLNAPKPGVINWVFFKVSAAYHLSLDKKQTNILTLGAQMASSTRTYNFNLNDSRAGILFGNNYFLNHYQKTYASQNDTKFKYKDLVVGLLFNARRKKSDLRLGFALDGLLGAKVGFSSNSAGSAVNKDSVETRDLGLNIHGEYRMDITPRTSIIPGFYYYSVGNANAFNVNTHAWYQFNPDMDFRGSVGLGVRNLRDVIVYVGAEMKDIQVGFAYDLNIDSRAIGSSGLGGFELSAKYLGKIYKKPKVKPIIFCPRL